MKRISESYVCSSLQSIQMHASRYNRLTRVRESKLQVVMKDLHEIRGYNLLGKFATARFLVFLQDDDAPGTVKTRLTLCRCIPAHSAACLGMELRFQTASNTLCGWALG